MVKTIIKKDEIAYDDIIVSDSSGNLITGLVDGNFTKYLYDSTGSEVSSSITVSITELGNRAYRASFTPNATGNWMLQVIHSTYFPESKSDNYECVENLNDDIAGAVWDVKKRDHKITGTFGHRVQHISGAFTKVVEKRLGVGDIRKLVDAIEEMFVRLIKANREKDDRKLDDIVEEIKKSSDDSQVLKLIGDVSGDDNNVIENLARITLSINILHEELNNLLNSIHGLPNYNSRLRDMTAQINDLSGFLSKYSDSIKSIMEFHGIESGKENELIHSKIIELHSKLDEIESLIIPSIPDERLQDLIDKEDEKEK